MTDPMKTASERLDELLGQDTPAPTLEVSLGGVEYPPDITKVSNEIWSYIQPIGGNGDEISRALVAERERCANICEVMCRECLDASDRTNDVMKNRSYAASAFSLMIAVQKIRGGA